MASQEPETARRSPAGPSLVLGTAQLGLPNYGRTNRTGQPSWSAALGLVRRAVEAGVREFDTARAYGDSESRLGQALGAIPGPVSVVTKLDPLADLGADIGREAVRAAVDASVSRSLQDLGLSTLPVLLLHRWAHRRQWSGWAWERLRELQEGGRIRRLGASVYSPQEALEALEDPSVGHLQVPFSLLDGRWLAAGVDRRAIARPDVVVHARSLFLQGILLHGPELWPPVATVDAVDWTRRIDGWVGRLGRRDRVDLCLAFGRAQSWIHGLVIGVDSVGHLEEILGHFQRAPLDGDEVRAVVADVGILPEGLLNPSLWPARQELK